MVLHLMLVTAGSVYEAVAAALAVLRGDEWVGQIGTGLTTVSVKVSIACNRASPFGPSVIFATELLAL